MSYTKTTWQTVDTVTAEKLNNIENGVAGAYPDLVLLYNAELSDPTTDHLSIISGSLEALEEKFAAGDYVNALLIVSYQNEGYDYPLEYRYNLEFFDLNYREFDFGKANQTVVIQYNASYAFTHVILE